MEVIIICIFVIVAWFISQVYLDGILAFLSVFVVLVKEAASMLEGREISCHSHVTTFLTTSLRAISSWQKLSNLSLLIFLFGVFSHASNTFLVLFLRLCQ